MAMPNRSSQVDAVQYDVAVHVVLMRLSLGMEDADTSSACLQVWTQPPQSLEWPRFTIFSLSLLSRPAGKQVPDQRRMQLSPPTPLYWRLLRGGQRICWSGHDNPSARRQPHEGEQTVGVWF